MELKFESDITHLKEICDYAFKGTDTFNNCHHKFCKFLEGLKYVGTKAFYNVDRSNDLIMNGFEFPSTLKAINVRAFANAGLICSCVDYPNWIVGSITFEGNFNLENMR